VVHPANELEISNACNFKAVRSIGLCGGLEMMDICERSAGGRLKNANLFAGCTTKGSSFNLGVISSWLLSFSLYFQYNFATVGVLELVVVIDVYAQPVREKIKFYRTASKSPF